MIKKSTVCLILICMLTTSILPVFAIEDYGTFTWEQRAPIKSYKAQETEWEFRPYENARSQQNPPDFSWPYVEGATSYEVIIASDPELNNIVYEKKDIQNNYYNFPYTFEKGRVYYWSVRYNNENGVSKWRDASRFIILPEATEYIVPEIEDTFDNIRSQSHPRFAVTPDTVDEARTIKDKFPNSQIVYDKVNGRVQTYMGTGIITNPKSTSEWSNANTIVLESSFVYLIGQDPKVGEFTKKQLLEMATWDVNGSTAYHVQDQIFRATMYNCSIAYDWIYELLTSEERKKVTEMVKQRMVILENPSNGSSDMARRVVHSPYLSHGWTAVKFILGSCIVMLDEFPEAEMFLRQYLPLFLNLQPPYSNEDGGWAQGVAYWSYVDSNVMEYTLKNTAGIDVVGSKAYYVNSMLYPVYTISRNMFCEFGDEGSHGGAPNANHLLAMNVYLGQSGNEYLKWRYDNVDANPTYTIMNYFLYATSDSTVPKAPVDLPRSKLYEDSGWVAMHSDLVNDNEKISLYFKSSPFGSFNHSHPDQNSFHIQAFGERLAIDSGYYDSYGSQFDLGYTKKTYAHNAITFDGGYGQPSNSKKANGKITNFLTHPDFDLTTGDATRAYNYVLDIKTGLTLDNETTDKAVRHIIYVRPDQFIVIDDLKVKNNNTVNFEWWLNAYEDISLYKSRTGARITKGDAVLDAKVHYPEVTGYYSDIFSGPDLVPYTNTKYGSNQTHKRVWFETGKYNKTKMITTMSVRTKNDEEKYVESDEFDNYTQLSFEDGTKAYIALNDSPIDTVNLKTDAAAVVVKGESIMMVDGTYLERRGERIVTADKPVSLVIGKSELGVSANKDVQLTVKTGEIISLKNERGIEEEPNQDTRGFNWNYTDGMLNINAFRGFYTYYVNDKSLPGRKVEDYTLNYTIDGEAHQTTLAGYINHDEEKALSGNINNSSGFYVVDEIKNVKLKGAVQGDTILLNNNEAINVQGDDAVLKLTSVGANKFTSDEVKDHNTLKGILDGFAEAEDYSAKDTFGKPYTTRKFLSGGAGVNGFDNFGDSMEWQMEVPQDGKYDVVIKYVGWSGTEGKIERLVSLNGIMGSTEMIETGSYGAMEEEWTAARIKVGAELKKGKNTLIFYPVYGQWNIDWVGLIKSDKQ